MTSARILIGVAGWSLPSRYRPDFPGSGSHLERYAARFAAVEINSSFYKPHRRATYERWAASVPEAFRFSVKVPRMITHDHRLVQCEPVLRQFLGEADGLGEKLGALLIQLPPSFAFAADIAAPFFAAARSMTTASLACEPRHPSWFEPPADDLLTDLGIARVAADPPPVASAAGAGGWPGLRYFRLHGSPITYRSAYGAERLAGYAEAIATAAETAETWCIFDNTMGMAALADALILEALIRKFQALSKTTAKQ